MRQQELLEKFCEAVRAKDNWAFKILDSERNLAEKWAAEAGLVEDSGFPSKDVSEVIRELKLEAERIQAYDHEIRLHSQQRPLRTIDFDDMQSGICKSLKYVIQSKYGLRHPQLRDMAGVYVSDGIVPPSLHRQLVVELDALASLEPKDFHPGTKGKVQDLIHPSLYPYIANVTPTNDPSKLPRLKNGMFETTMWTGYDLSAADKLASRYSWLPSKFRVSNDGTDVHIESYINGLGPREHFSNLYRLIERTFLIMLPHFERTLGCQFERGTPPSVERWMAREDEREGTTLENWNALLVRQKELKAKQLAEMAAQRQEMASEMRCEWERASQNFEANDVDISSSFKGRSLKVIVKAANYILLPGQTYEGTWHLEGMPHEKIIASAIYYYDVDNSIVDDGLALRRARDQEKDFPGMFDYTHENFYTRIRQKRPAEEGDFDTSDTDDEAEIFDYPSDIDMDSGYIDVGVVPTTNVNADGQTPIGYGTGRIISFPNWLQHRVVGVKNGNLEEHASPSDVARRKILCFFLVNDDNPPEDTVDYPGFSYSGLLNLSVLTTADVPPQQRGTNVPTLHVLLPFACKGLTGKDLPPELVDLIVRLADLGLTREMAESHRRAFMKDRKIKAATENDAWEREFSLCEH